MDDKMKAAFETWGVERSKKISTLGVPTPYEYAEWALDYLRSQQEPVVEVWRNSAGQISLRGPDGDAWDMSKFVGSKLFSHPIPSAPAVPEGWVMVPVQPTEVMKAAGCRALGALYGHYGAEQCWKAMLDAAMRKENSND